MSIDWDGYKTYDPGIGGDPRVLSRADARKVFRQCMETKSARLDMLSRLLRANGVVSGKSDSSIQDLNDWFVANVEADPSRPGGLHPSWCSVVHDVALFLGDVMIERSPNLRWEFFTWGRSNVAFQRHVIMGFGSEDPRFHTNIDIDRMVANYAHRLIEVEGSVPDYGIVNIRDTVVDVDAAMARHRTDPIELDAFWRWLRTASQRA